MYEKSAEFYDLLYNFKDYPAACQMIKKTIDDHRPEAKTLLDVGCSTGRHLEHLRHHYNVTGFDINPGLLEVAKNRCPDVPFFVGNMIDFNLSQRFDVVTCLFASIAYVRTVDCLSSTFRCFADHLNPGGLLVVEPWISPEQYWERNVVLNTAQSEDMKIAWMYVGKRNGLEIENHIHYLVGTPSGVSHFTETHHMGLFRKQDYLSAIEAAKLSFVSFDPKGYFGNGLFLARRG